MQEYIDEQGRSRFAEWFENLNAAAAAKIAVALERLSQGNLSAVKSVGEGVSECRVDFGPGYRVYFGREGDVLVILLSGGSKKRQSRDIQEAQIVWREYKRRKRETAWH